MLDRPPPSRYKVIEQGRRLVVIDTRTGATATPPAPSLGGPASARSLIGSRGTSIDGAVTRTLAAVRPASFPAAPDQGNMPLTPERSASPAPTGSTFTTRSPVTLLGGTSASSFTTSAAFDNKGPRTIALTDDARGRLGVAIGLSVSALVVAVILALATSSVLLFVAAIALAQARVREVLRGATTAVIDWIAG